MTTTSQPARFDPASCPDHLHNSGLPVFASMGRFVEFILNAERRPLAPSVQALGSYIAQDEAVTFLVDKACAENRDLVAAGSGATQGVPIPRIGDADTLLHGLNAIITEVPGRIDNQLIGLPFAAFMAGIAATRSGASLLRLPSFNLLMAGILSEWNAFRDTPARNAGCRVGCGDWPSVAAGKRYWFPLWEKDAEILHYWNSWSDFLTRQFKHPDL